MNHPIDLPTFVRFDFSLRSAWPEENKHIEMLEAMGFYRIEETGPYAGYYYTLRHDTVPLEWWLSQFYQNWWMKSFLTPSRSVSKLGAMWGKHVKNVKRLYAGE